MRVNRPQHESRGPPKTGRCTHFAGAVANGYENCPNGSPPTNGICPGTPSSIGTAYIYLAGKQIAEQTTAGVTQHVHTDALGSPVAHTNTAGSIINRTRYEPYGYTAQGTKPGPTTSAIGFTGHVNDPDTDLVYMQQRYYDPIAGRFLSVDPVVTDANTGKGFGLYAYVDNNPYSKIDPDGRSPFDVAFLAYDVVKFGVAVYSGVGVGATAVDVAISLAGVASPIPGAGQVLKGLRAAERVAETVKAGEKVVETAMAGEKVVEGASRLLAKRSKLSLTWPRATRRRA